VGADEAVQERIQRAIFQAGDADWNVVKVRANSVSLLLYETFDEAAFPSLLAAVRVDLKAGSVARTDYRRRDNPPILHRKETLLLPDDPRRPAFAALTRLAEEYGLFAEPHRIGTRRAWLERLNRAGLKIQGAKLLRCDEKTVDVVRHRTAIIRRDLSQPMQILAAHEIISTQTTIFDYGCGQGDDVAGLAENGFKAFGWDPHYAPNGPRESADVVNLGFVLNVIEDRHERAETLKAAYGFTRRALCIAVMPIGKAALDSLQPYGDGYVTLRGTFQKYFAQQDLRDFIADVLGEGPIAFAPGIFVVFRDKLLEQEVLFKRRNRTIAGPISIRPPQRERRELAIGVELANLIKPELEMLWAAMLERGRALDIEEFPSGLVESLRKAKVSSARATDLCLTAAKNRDQLAASAAIRREDLLVNLALTLFPGAPRYTNLPRSIQRDIRAFFGNHSKAIQEANALLFSVGKPEVLRDSVTKSIADGLGGKRDSDTFRVYSPALNRLPAVIRVLVGCAGVLRGGTEDADFIDIKLDFRRVTFIACVDAKVRLPVYAERTRIDIGRQRVFVDQPTGMILYLKSRFLPSDTPGIEEQKLFDKKLIDAGIVDDDGKGPRYPDLKILLSELRDKMALR
jgi:DNA phosphorothioation-associated putative methyltransferase